MAIHYSINGDIWDRIRQSMRERFEFNQTIDLHEVEPGVYRKLQPEEDIHHPDHFEAKKDIQRFNKKQNGSN